MRLPPFRSRLDAGVRVLARHLRYARLDPYKLAWIAGRATRMAWHGEVAGVLARHAHEQRLSEAYVTRLAEPCAQPQAPVAPAVPRPAGAPTFVLVMPVYAPVPAYLEAAVASVRAQRYPHWELRLVDDGSPGPAIGALVEAMGASDPRIRTLRLARNAGIVAASNAALAIDGGDYVGFVDQDDMLDPDALAHVAEAIARRPQVELLYSDEDRIDENGRRQRPLYKCGWNVELLRSINCVLHFVIVRRSLLARLGGFRAGLDGVQDWDLALRAAEVLAREAVCHLPHVLYHWRIHPGSTAAGPYEKRGMRERQRCLVLDSIARRGERARPSWAIGGWRLRFDATALPISIVVVARRRSERLERWLRALRSRLARRRVDMVVVLPADAAPAVRMHPATGRHVVVDVPYEPTRLADRGIRAATEAVVVLVREEMTLGPGDAIDELVGHAARPHVGLVGAMLYGDDGRIVHAGYVLGGAPLARTVHSGQPRGYRGPDGLAGYAQEVGAVATACSALRRDRYLAVGGFDATLGGPAADIDLCLKLRASGGAVLWTPHAWARGAAKPADLTAAEEAELRARWPRQLDDPYYNPNYAAVGEPYTLGDGASRTVASAGEQPGDDALR